jgi:hypothetical protein
MAKKNRFFPFRWLPGSWGLVGQPFEEAKAHYEFDGEDLERALVDIRETDTVRRQGAHLLIDVKYGVRDVYSAKLLIGALETGTIDPVTKLDIDLEYGKIDAYQYDCKLAVINYPDPNSMEQQVALLTADYDHGKIEKLEYDKTLATAKDEPWVGIVDNGFNPDDGVNGLYFELDWNAQWVDHLRKHGYHGVNDEQIVEQWFSDVCRSQGEDATPDDHDPIPFNSGRVINRRRGDGGSTEYS